MEIPGYKIKDAIGYHGNDSQNQFLSKFLMKVFAVFLLLASPAF